MRDDLLVRPRQAIDPVIVLANFDVEKTEQLNRAIALQFDLNQRMVELCAIQFGRIAHLEIRAGDFDDGRGLHLKLFVQHLNAPNVTATFEFSAQPDAHDLQGFLCRYHPLTERDHIRIVMLPSESRGLSIPTQSAAHTPDAICRHRFAVARAAENYASIKFGARHGECDWPAEQRIVNRLFRISSKISYVVTESSEKIFDPLFVLKAGVIRADGDFHLVTPR